MQWPLEAQPIPPESVPLMNAMYLHGCDSSSDPSMVWGTRVPMDPLHQLVDELNEHADVLISPCHLLMKAVALALKEHPQFNRRVLGRRIYEYRDVGILVAFHHPAEHHADLALIPHAAGLNIEEMAEHLWQCYHEARRGEYRYDSQKRLYRAVPAWVQSMLLRLNRWMINRINLPATSLTDRQRCSPVLVNYLAAPGVAPQHVYKPSRPPVDCCPLNVTLGPEEQTPVVEDGQIVARPISLLTVRADHRLVDACELGRFTETIRQRLRDPRQLQHAQRDGNSGETKSEDSVPALVPEPQKA